MKIGTILFTYNRSRHTKEVVEALSLNTKKPDKLFIFQDGMGTQTNSDEWKAVRDIITNISWCDTQIFISDKNKGCSRSIIDGINYVLQEYEAVIVLEDDCVPHPRFLDYMYQALQQYRNYAKVYSVGGYAWEVDLPSSQMDAYFNKRTSSWGWGTWKDRWKQFEEDYQIIRRIKKTEAGKKQLDIWGADLENMVVGNITGDCDAWDVFWSLTVIEHDGVCLSPYNSLIHNIGMDGSGTHSPVRRDDRKKTEKKYGEQFVLPNEITISRECEIEFYNLFSGIHGAEKFRLYQQVLLDWVKIKQMGGEIGRGICDGPIAIWGKGKICDLFLRELQEIINIKCILESYPSVDRFQGIPVCGITELPDEVKTVIVIPFFDIKKILYKVKKYRDDINLIGIDKLIKKAWNNLEEIK